MKSIFNLIVYIVECSDGSYYTGVTNDLDRRIAEHNSALNPDSYTHDKTPVQLVFALGFNDRNLAITFEKKIKGWTRKKKEALIKWDWEKIRELAKCTNDTSHLLYKKET